MRGTNGSHTRQLWKFLCISGGLTGLDGTVMLQRVDYNVSGYVPSTLPVWRDTMDNIPRISPADVVYSDEVGENRKPLKLRLQ